MFSLPHRLAAAAALALTLALTLAPFGSATLRAQSTAEGGAEKPKAKSKPVSSASDKPKSTAASKDKNKEKAQDKTKAAAPAGAEIDAAAAVPPPVESTIPTPMPGRVGKTPGQPPAPAPGQSGAPAQATAPGSPAPAGGQAQAKGKRPAPLPTEADATDYLISPERVGKAVFYEGGLVMTDETAHLRRTIGKDKVVWARTFRALEDQAFGTTSIKLGVRGSLIDAKLIKLLDDSIAEMNRRNPGIYGPVQKFQLADGAIGYAFKTTDKENLAGVSGFVISRDGNFEIACSVLFDKRYPIKRKQFNVRYISILEPTASPDSKKTSLELNNVGLIKLVQLTLGGTYVTCGKDYRIFAAKQGGGKPATQLASPTPTPGAPAPSPAPVAPHTTAGTASTTLAPAPAPAPAPAATATPPAGAAPATARSTSAPAPQPQQPAAPRTTPARGHEDL